MAEKLLKIKGVFDPGDVQSGLDALTGNLRGVGKAAIDAAGGKEAWAEFGKELKVINPALESVSSLAFDAARALDQMGRSGDNAGSIEAAATKAVAKLAALKDAIEAAEKAGGTIGPEIKASISQMETAVESGIAKSVALRRANEAAAETVRKLAADMRGGATAVDLLGNEFRISAEKIESARKKVDEIRHAHTKTGEAQRESTKIVRGLDDVFEKMGETGTGLSGKIGKLGLAFISLAAVYRESYELGRDIDEGMKKTGLDLSDLGNGIDGVTHMAASFALKLSDILPIGEKNKALLRDMAKETDGLSALTEPLNVKMNARIKAEQAHARGLQETDAALKAVVPGYQSYEDRVKSATEQVAAWEARATASSRAGKDWKQDVEQNAGAVLALKEELGKLNISADKIPQVFNDMAKAAEAYAAAAKNAKEGTDGLKISSEEAAARAEQERGYFESLTPVYQNIAKAREQAGETEKAAIEWIWREADAYRQLEQAVNAARQAESARAQKQAEFDQAMQGTYETRKAMLDSMTDTLKTMTITPLEFTQATDAAIDSLVKMADKFAEIDERLGRSAANMVDYAANIRAAYETGLTSMIGVLGQLDEAIQQMMILKMRNAGTAFEEEINRMLDAYLQLRNEIAGGGLKPTQKMKGYDI